MNNTKRLRVTVDLYVDMVDGLSEEEALEMVEEFIQCSNKDCEYTGYGVAVSEPVSQEVYEDDE